MKLGLSLGAIIAAIGGAASAIITIGGFLANIITIPFRMFENQPYLGVVIYWLILSIDVFIIGGITRELFASLGVENFELNFTSILLLFPNLFGTSILGWTTPLLPIHVFGIFTMILILGMAVYLYIHHKS